jgi:carboxyl-terminal processing protease
MVLINKNTASSAEILAAALVDAGRARLVGETTLGKGSVERVEKLENGWGLKLSVARFSSPKGRSWQGVGLEPDFAITGGAREDGYNFAPKVSAATDPQLRAALALLHLQR